MFFCQKQSYLVNFHCGRGRTASKCVSDSRTCLKPSNHVASALPNPPPCRCRAGSATEGPLRSVPFRHGYPLGRPNDPRQQHTVIEAALSLLEDEALAPPALGDYDGS